VRIFLLFSLFLSFSLSNAIPIDVNLNFEDDYVQPSSGYSEPDPDRYNLQKVSVEYDQIAPTSFHLDGSKLAVTFLDDPLHIKRISKSSGELESFEYPSVNSNVSYTFESVRFNKSKPYILDENLNTIWMWDEPSGFWSDIRDEYDVPNGDIYDIYFFGEVLHLVLFDGFFYSIWNLASGFEKIDEMVDEPKTIVSYLSTPIIISDTHVKKIGNEFAKVSYGLNTIYTYRAYKPTFTEDGVLLSASGSGSRELIWYSFSDNSITKIYEPEVAEESKGCSNYSTVEIHCMFQTGPSELAIYKLDDGVLELDSVFSFNDESIDLRGVSLFSVYGKTRIIQLLLEKENSSHLLEWSPIKFRTLSSTPDGQYHYYLGLNPLDSKNYFLRSSETGVEINRYDIEGSSETSPLVADDEYPEYRVMEVEDFSSSDSGIGSMPTYLLAMLLILLTPRIRSNRVSGV